MFARAQSMNYRVSNDAQTNFTTASDGRSFFGIVRDPRITTGARQMEIAPSGSAEEVIPYFVNGTRYTKPMLGRGPQGHGRLATLSGWTQADLGGYSLQRLSSTSADFRFNSGTLNPTRYGGGNTMPLESQVALVAAFDRDLGVRSTSLFFRLLVGWFG
jgi:hypothetical protein